MTEQEFAEALGFTTSRANNLTLEAATRWLLVALKEWIPTEEKSSLYLCGTTVVAWDSDGMVLQDFEGKLYGVFVTHPLSNRRSTLIADQDSKAILDMLREANILDQFVSSIAVAEYLRLREGRSL